MRAGSSYVPALAALVLAAPGLAQPTADDAAYRAGIGFLRKGMHDLAGKELRAYLDAHPTGEHATHARYALGVCLVRLGQCDRAGEELARVLSVEGFEFAPDARLLAARCAADKGDDARVVELLTPMARSHPSFAQLDRALAQLGEALYRLGRFDDASKTLAKVRADFPQSPAADRADLFVAMSLQRTGDTRGALDRASALLAASPKSEVAPNAALLAAQCAQALGETARAMEMYQLAATQGKDDVRFEARLGQAQLALAQGDRALAARALQGLEPPSAPDGRVRLALVQASMHLDEGQAKNARRTLRDAESNAEHAPEIALALARADALEGKHDECVARLTAAIDRAGSSPLLPRLRFELASAHSRAGHDDLALQAWQSWLKAYPRHDLAPDAALALAWCLHRAGNYADSEQWRARATSDGTRESIALLAAENAFAQDDLPRARSLYDGFAREHARSPQTPRARLRAAICAVRTDANASAEQALAETLASDPPAEASLRVEALSIAGDRAMARQDWSAGERWFVALLKERGAPAPDARLRLGVCLARQGKHDEAIAVLEPIAADEGAGDSRGHAGLELARCLLNRDRPDEARRALRRVAEQPGADATLTAHARRELAALDARQGKPEDAARTLAALPDADPLEVASAWLAANKPEEARRVLDRLARAGAPSPRAGVLLASTLNRLDRHEEALSALDAVRDVASLDDETRALATYERAIACEKLSRTSQASEAYHALADQGPPRWRAHALLALGQSALDASKADDALTHARAAQSAIKDLPDSDAAPLRERAMYQIASALLALDKPQQALDETQDAPAPSAASTSGPARALALVRAQALVRVGKARLAGEALDALAEGPERDDVARSAALRAGEAWAACEDWARSERAYRAFLDADPNSPLWFHALFGIGWARERAARFDEAIEAYRQIVARHDGPTAARAQFQIGECLFAQNALESAVAELLKVDVLHASPEWSPAALYEAGRCLAQLNRADDAARQFDEVIERFPDSRWASLAREAKAARAPATQAARTAPAAPATRTPPREPARTRTPGGSR